MKLWIFFVVAASSVIAFPPHRQSLSPLPVGVKKATSTCKIPVRTKKILVERGAAALQLFATLKPAADPLMAAGNLLAALGEKWIDQTKDTDVYGGSLSSAGANVRNAGDHVAQAAASCRFKTGTELVAEELREAGTALDAAADFLEQAVDDLQPGEGLHCGIAIEPMVAPMRACSRSLEASGAAVLHRESVQVVGQHLEEAGSAISTIANEVATPMIRAGSNLQGKHSPKPTGKAWLKGGNL